MKCITGNCTSCGFGHKFPLCKSNEVQVEGGQLQWSRFEKVPTGEGTDQNGKEKTRLQIVKKTTSKVDFLEYLAIKVPEFVRHDFVYRWEDVAFHQSMATFPTDAIFSVIDYAENYSMVPHDEIQADHWTST